MHSLPFKSTVLFDFINRFKTEDDCLRYLSNFKWADGFVCTKCGHNHYWDGTKPHSRVCKKCRKIHSPTQNTIFHGLKFSILKAFHIIFEISASTKSMSDLQISRRYGINRNTAWLFMRKYRESLKSSGEKPMGVDEGSKVYVDEFVVGGYEIGMTGRSGKSKKRKMVVAVETTSENKIKRVYGLRINDYSTNDLRTIFDKFISKTASVFTDGWTSYLPLRKVWNIASDEENMKNTTHPMNIAIQQFKSWVRGIHHHVSAPHIEGYMNEFSFRINRSQWKDVCFHSAIMKGISHLPLLRKDIPKKAEFGLR